MKQVLFPCLFSMLLSCANTKTPYETTGNIERHDEALDALIDQNAKIEIIAEGFVWTEGPLWVENQNMLLFSDVPQNTIYKWTEESGYQAYLNPSGYTGDNPDRLKEPGSNGLTLDNTGNLVLCQHGNRQIARMDATLQQPEAKFIILANQYQGKRLNSPNDVIYSQTGELFFTDPPYGLPTQSDDDPDKELPFNGVYKVDTQSEITLLSDQISKPNGIALFPDGKTLLIGNSDPNAANWYTLDLSDSTAPPQLFYSATQEREGVKGLPDGLKIDQKGNVYASGPGGIWIFDSTGKVLGKIKLDDAASNVALSADEKTLYITNSGKVLRVKLR